MRSRGGREAWLSFSHAHSCLLSKALGPNVATDCMGLLGHAQKPVTGPPWAPALVLWLVHLGWQVIQVLS